MYTGLQNAGGQIGQPTGTLPIRSFQVINDCHTVLEQLTEALSPILLPDAPTINKETVAVTELLQQLESLNRRLNQLRSRVSL